MKKLCTTINNVEIDSPVGGRPTCNWICVSGFISVLFLRIYIYALQETFGHLNIYMYFLATHVHFARTTFTTKFVGRRRVYKIKNVLSTLRNTTIGFIHISYTKSYFKIEENYIANSIVNFNTETCIV